MEVNATPTRRPESNNPGSIFLSGSIPDAARWDGGFNPLEITDAVVAFARACLTSGYQIVTAAHPTIAPLLLYVAAELPSSDEPRVIVYQSMLFESVLPTATRRFEASGVGELVWTEAAEHDAPRPGRWDASLREMRSRMFRESDPRAAVFIGGMAGVRDEFLQFTDLYPDRPTLAAHRPGGEAARLFSEHQEARNHEDGDRSLSYPTLWRRFIGTIRPISESTSAEAADPQLGDAT